MPHAPLTAAFYRDLLAWYDVHKRPLPWRAAPTPYAVWISEIMAQQTQMSRVVEYFDRWMDAFPDLKTLANANEEQVLKRWEGLGYYSRARNILKGARQLQQDGGRFPDTVEGIRSLPGVGPYTAGAIASIAYGQPVPAVDANVLRVFARLLDESRPVSGTPAKRAIHEAVTAVMPQDRPGDFNQALMEFGALVCGKSPRCAECPLTAHCMALAAGTVAERPVLPKAKEIIRIDMATGVLVHAGRVLVQKRRPDDVWPGLWEFPGGVLEPGETPRQALVREYQEEVELTVEPREKITVVRYSYTRYRVTMHAYFCTLKNGQSPEPVFNAATEGGFVSPARLGDYAYPAGHRRLLEALQADVRWGALLAETP